MLLGLEAAKRFVEITMVGYARLNNPEQLQQMMNSDPANPTLPDTVILNYRFIRDYTKNVSDSWTVNIVNHVLLKDMIELN